MPRSHASHFVHEHQLVQARYLAYRRRLDRVFVYFLRNTHIHLLADEVMDCDDHLKVRRGRTEEIIRFSNIATADVSTSSGIHRITVRLRQPAKLGGQIEFLPQASLWSNLSGVKRVAAGLAERANQANDGRDQP